MEKTLFRWQFAGFIFTCALGTLLHFLYDWSGGAVFIAPFSAVNESTWEHMKILFFPMFLFSFFERHLSGEKTENFWCVKLRGILLGIIMIPILFYTYNGVFGTSASWVNIAIFYISAAIAYCVETKLFKKKIKCVFSQTMAFSLLCVVALLFVLFTFFTPHISIFRDPLTSTFGI